METREGRGGRRRASMREVARLANVAISSVSRVLSGHPDVSEEMRTRVLDAVAQLEYEPDFLARSLRRGQTLSVGFVLADISNPLMAGIVQGAEAVLRASGYTLLLMDSESETAQDLAHIRFFLSRRVDGMLLSLAADADPAVLTLLAEAGSPVVLVDRTFPSAEAVSAVFSDHAAGMTAAAAHLIALGHRRIALVTGGETVLPGRERVAGLRAAVEAHGGAVTALVRAGSFSAAFGENATAELLASPEPPTAIIAGGNQILTGCLRALRSAGVAVGAGGVSLVTCDDVPINELHSPPLAAIERDVTEIGRTAAELLLRRLAGGQAETVRLPTRFVPRASCAAP